MTLPVLAAKKGSRCCDPTCDECNPKQEINRRKALEALGVGVFLLAGALGRDRIPGLGTPATADAAPAPKTPAPEKPPAKTKPPAQIKQVTARDLLSNPRLTLTNIAHVDLEHDRINPILLQLLGYLLTHHTLTVSCLKTGHTKHVGGDPSREVSQHYYGQAADISVVDGSPVRDANEAARRIVLGLARWPAEGRPTEVGHPWVIPANDLDGFFTNLAHEDHLHIGIRGLSGIAV